MPCVNEMIAQPEKICPTCEGTGLVADETEHGNHIIEDCPDCNGTGIESEEK